MSDRPSVKRFLAKQVTCGKLTLFLGAAAEVGKFYSNSYSIRNYTSTTIGCKAMKVKQIMKYFLIFIFGGGAWAFADSSVNTAYNGNVNTIYSSNPNLNESANKFKPLFKSGWYGHSRDVTYMKIAQIESNLGVLVLYSDSGYFCPVNQYLLFKNNPSKANSYIYQMDKQCIATITVDNNKKTLVMTVNSRSACFEEPVYSEFCNGNENIHITDEPASNLFINKIFTYQKEQNDNNYNWDD